MTLVALGVFAFACLIALKRWHAARLLALICMLSAGATGAVSAQATGTIGRQLLLDQWNGWEDLGARTVGRPECVATQPNRLDCFTRINGGMLTRKQWDGQRWVGPTLLGGLEMHAGFASHADCVTWEADHVDCFMRGRADNAGRSAVFHRTIHGGFVTGWEALGGEVTSDPECVAVRVGRIECFARGASGQLVQNSFDGDIWSGWIARGGQLAADLDISCVMLRSEISCVVVTPQSRLQQMRFTSTGVDTRAMQGGDVLGAPKCYVMTGANSADFDDAIVCVAPRFTILGRWIWDGTGNLNWALSDMGGPIAGADFDCVTRGGERLDCMELVVTVDSFTRSPTAVSLRHRYLQAGQGVTQSGNVLTLQNGAPAFVRCLSWAPDRIDCFIGGGNAPLLHSFLVPTVIERRRGL